MNTEGDGSETLAGANTEEDRSGARGNGTHDGTERTMERNARGSGTHDGTERARDGECWGKECQEEECQGN